MLTCKGSWAWVALFLKAFVRSPRLSALWNGVGGVLRWSHTLTPPYPHLGVIVIFSFFFNFPLHFSPQHLPLYFRKFVTSDLWPNNILYLVNKKKTVNLWTHWLSRFLTFLMQFLKQILDAFQRQILLLLLLKT